MIAIIVSEIKKREIKMLVQLEIRVSATDFCGFEEDYVVISGGEDEALEDAEEAFIQQFSLECVGEGLYVEMSDVEEYDIDPESVLTTTISSGII
jgi:hypothetical protein